MDPRPNPFTKLVSMQPTIEIIYTCDLCATKDRKLRVRVRGDGEAVEVWMNAVVHAIARDHFHRNPLCQAKTITSVKIPMGPTDGPHAARIGEQPPSTNH